MRIAWLQRAFLAVIAAASLYASVANLLATPELGRPLEDPVADWERRFAPLKQQIPFVRGYVGYISESDVPGAPFDPANDEGEYILTQYALAPIIIIRGTDHEWNVANLSPEAFALWKAQNSGGFEIQSFRGGLYLLRKTSS